MAVTTINNGLSQEKGINYTVITDSSADWASVANSTYFYDKTDGLPHYKDGSGNVLEVFASSGGGGGHEIYSGTGATALSQQPGLRFKGYLEAVDDAGDSETEVDIASGSLAVANTSRFDLNGSGDVDLKIASNKLLTGDVNGFATELTVTTDSILGLDTNSEVVEYEVVEIYNILAQTGIIADGQLLLTDINGASANIKAKFEINSIAIKNTTANGVTINIGSTTLGTDVANSVVIAPNSISKIPLGTTFFSDATGTDLYISSGNWNSSSININISIQKIWQ